MKYSKRAVAFLLAIVMLFGALYSGLTAVAASGEKMVSSMIDLPRSDDPNKTGWGHPDLTFLGGWSAEAREGSFSVHVQDTFEGRALYCIEPGIHSKPGTEYDSFGEGFWDNYPADRNPTIPPSVIKEYLGRIMQYGWQGNGNLSWDSSNPDHANEIAAYIATQLLVWETIVGERDREFQKIDASAQGKDNIAEYVQSGHPLYDLILEKYYLIEGQVQRHTTLPSFLSRDADSADTMAFKWDGQRYSITLTDANDILDEYTFSSDVDGIEFSMDGNQLTISCDTAPAEAVHIVAERNNSQRSGLIIWWDGITGSGVQDFATYGVTVSDPIYGYLNLKADLGGMKMIKTSEDGKVEGISFTITGEGYNATRTTDANGEISITDLSPGVYTVTEQNYDVYEPQQSQSVTIVSGQTSTVHFNNVLKRGGLQVVKTADDQFVEGITFHLYGASSSGLPVDEYAVTGKDGIATFENVLIGSGYTLEEVDTETRYEIPSPQDVTICWDDMTQKEFHNALKRFQIIVRKCDGETGKAIPYAGVGFELFDPDGNRISDDILYTDKDGTLTIPEKLEYGLGYSLVEVSAPHGYVLDSEPVYFDVTKDAVSSEAVIEVTKTDIPQKGIVNISKSGEVFSTVTEQDGIYQPVYEERGLPGATYEITAAEDIYTLDGTLRYSAGEVVDTITTGDDRTAQSNPLYLGKYNVKETQAPYGMILNEEVREVELAYAGQEVEITETSVSFYNERQKAMVSLDKALEQDETFGIGMNGEITAVTFGLFAAEDLTAADGAVIPAGGLLETLSVDENGCVVCKTDLPFGRYYLQELTTDEHYVLSDEKYPFEFSYLGQDDALVEIKVNGGEAVNNDLIYGEVHGFKKDEDGNGLEGAVIGLFQPDCTEFTSENAILTTTSAEDGSFSFANVPYGNWVVCEIEAPAGFVLSEVPIAITINQDGAVIEVEIENTNIRGNVQLTKVDRDNPENKLTGAEFAVYRDGNGNQVFDEDDGLIGNLAEVATGVYEMRDLAYGGYFIKETKAPEGFYLDENAYYFEITEHGKTVTVENESGKGFVNTPQIGSLKIVKTSSDGKVEGFSFRVTGPNGYDHTFQTDANGEILIEGLRIGDYEISEVSDDVSKGYLLPEDKKATVKENAVTIVEMRNEAKSNPNTGDDSNPGLWLTFLILSGIGAVVLFLRVKKEHEKWN